MGTQKRRDVRWRKSEFGGEGRAGIGDGVESDGGQLKSTSGQRTVAVDLSSVSE